MNYIIKLSQIHAKFYNRGEKSIERMNKILLAVGIALILLSGAVVYALFQENSNTAGFEQVRVLKTISNSPFKYPGFMTRNSFPMGIADYGVSFLRGKNTTVYYEYTTEKFLGIINIYSLKTYSSNPDVGGWVSVQLNAVLAGTGRDGGYNFTYWVQDLAEIDTAGNTVYFGDNVWVLPPGPIQKDMITGRGYVQDTTFMGKHVSFYMFSTFPQEPLNYPARIMMMITVSLSGNHPTLMFYYDSGNGWQCFDTVNINVTVTGDYGFRVNGLGMISGNYTYSTEFVLAGPWSGESTGVTEANITMGLQYWNGHNFQDVPCAFNYGSNTGESIGGLSIRPAPGYQGNITAIGVTGYGKLLQLYSIRDMGSIMVKSPGSYGKVTINGNQYYFSGGVANITVPPGNYTVTVFSPDGKSTTEGVSVRAGQTATVSAQDQSLLILCLLAISMSIALGITAITRKKKRLP
ncbi:MAG: thermopsin family protease [Thermoplasmata archaeon]